MMVDLDRWQDAARGSVALRDAMQAALGLSTTIYLPAPSRARALVQEMTETPKRLAKPPKPVCNAARDIQRVVADYYGITFDQLIGQSRARDHVRPRQMAALLVKEMLDKSYPDIGRMFGDRDHSTMIYGVRSVLKRIRDGGDDAEDYAALLDILAPEAMAA